MSFSSTQKDIKDNKDKKENDNIKKPAAQKRSRSRNGCSTCRKSKVKCDEVKPICGNCLKFSKKCDYSIKLTWGGRPYKIPKIEKLNPVANLSRIQLNQNVENINNDQTYNHALTNSITNTNTTIKSIKEHQKNFTNVNIIKFTNDNNDNNIKFKSNNDNIQPTYTQPSLNPTDNLNFLLKMSSKSTTMPNLLQKVNENNTLSYIKPESDEESVFQSLEETTNNVNENNNNNNPVSSIASSSLDFNHSVSNNIQNVNSMLGSMFNEKLVQMSPWSLLEELDNSQLLKSPTPQLNNKIIELEEFNEFNNTVIKPNLNAIENMYSHNFQQLDLTDEFKLDNFAVDLSKIHESSDQTHSLISIPMISEIRRTPKNSIEENDDNLDNINTININNNNNNNNNNVIVVSPSTSSISEILEPIPRGLLPLPDMLLNVPYYYDSFLFYINSTSSVLTPADSNLYINNPFKMVLPKLAMTNEGLMSLVVAFGAAHKGSLLRQDPTEIVDALLSRALSDLLVLLNNKETCTSDLTLTIVLLFSSFLAFNYKSDKWKVHLHGAKQIFLLRGYNKPFDKLLSDFKTDGSLISGEIKKSKLLYFLIRWFAYIDIFTNLSTPLEPTEEEIIKFCSNSPGNESLSPISDSFSSPNSNFVSSPNSQKIEQIDGNNELNDNQIDYEIIDTPDLLKDESHKDIDYMLGFKIKFLPIFSQLSKLIKYVNLTKRANERMNQIPIKTASVIGLSPKIIESAINIQTKFQKLKYVDYINDDGTLFAKSINSIIASNHCFLLMGMIQLYRRVLLMPRNSKVIQELCVEVLNTIHKYLNTKEPNSLGVILPLFIAGCECQKISSRSMFIEKLNDFQEKGSVSAGPAIEIMTKCWETDDDWCDVMLRENKIVVFL
jgi:hypothetical protein